MYDTTIPGKEWADLVWAVNSAKAQAAHALKQAESSLMAAKLAFEQANKAYGILYEVKTGTPYAESLEGYMETMEED